MKSQSLNRLAIFIKLLFISVSALLLLIIFILFYLGYERTVGLILDFYDMQDKTASFKEELLTPRTFQFIKISLVLFCLVFISTGFIFKNKIELFYFRLSEVLNEFKKLLKSIFKEILNLSAYQKLLFLFLMLAIIAARSYYLYIYPLTNDEVFSYLYFIDKGFLVTVSYYPGPNNHIFYSLLCVISDIFSDNPLLIMRVPALLIGLAASFFMFILVNKRFGFVSAFFSTLFFSFSYDTFYYSIHGRGYTLLSLFLLIAFFSFFKIFESNNSNTAYKIIFAISSVLGFYTVPIFLYPFLCFVLSGSFYLIVKKDFQALKKFILLNTSIGILTLILYSPVILISGISALISNKWVASLSQEDFFNSFQIYPVNLFNYLWNVESMGLLITIILLISVIIVLIKRKAYYFIGFILIFFLLPFVVMFIQKVLPPFRALDYMLVIIAVLCGILLQALTDLLHFKILRNMLFLSVSLWILLFNLNCLNNEKERGFSFYTRLNTFVAESLDERMEKVFVNEDTYQLFFKFKVQQVNSKVKVYTEPRKNEKYDLIVIPRGTEFPRELNKSDYQYYISNKDIDSFKKIK